jgi:YggT family protein
MRAILDVILLILQIYVWLLIAAAILSWLVAFNVVNTRNQFVASVGEFLFRITEPALRPIRSILPNLGGIDVSPVVLILIIFFIQNVIVRYIYPNVFWAIVTETAAAYPWILAADGLLVSVRLTPKGGRDAIDGIEQLADGRMVLKVRVRAAPSEGEANTALVGLLARTTRIAPGRICLVSGAAARIKRIKIEGEPAALAAALVVAMEKATPR